MEKDNVISIPEITLPARQNPPYNRHDGMTSSRINQFQIEGQPGRMATHNETRKRASRPAFGA